MNTDTPIGILWLDFCMASDGASIRLGPYEMEAAGELEKAGLVTITGRWAKLTEDGKRRRDRVTM